MAVPIAALIAQIGIPVLTEILSKSINKIKHPTAKKASAILDELVGLINNRDISKEEMLEINRHTEKMADIVMKGQALAISEINKTARSEILSEDKYVRRMRPTFGYLMALTWAAQMFAVAYIIIFNTDKAHIILQAMESLGTIWAVALSVLGIYVYKRSDDKATLWYSKDNGSLNIINDDKEYNN